MCELTNMRSQEIWERFPIFFTSIRLSSLAPRKYSKDTACIFHQENDGGPPELKEMPFNYLVPLPPQFSHVDTVNEQWQWQWQQQRGAHGEGLLEAR